MFLRILKMRSLFKNCKTLIKFASYGLYKFSELSLQIRKSDARENQPSEERLYPERIKIKHEKDKY